jgi:hypothetical protein
MEGKEERCLPEQVLEAVAPAAALCGAGDNTTLGDANSHAVDPPTSLIAASLGHARHEVMGSDSWSYSGW